MNKRALLQLGSELLFDFRKEGGPADRVLAKYAKDRPFLGSNDRQFLSDIYFHVLRHLRRYDEAIISAFSGSIAVEVRASSGFPVTQERGARSWQRLGPGEKRNLPEKRSRYDRVVDTVRLGIAAVELGLDDVGDVTEELQRAWPQPKDKRPMPPKAIARMMERAVEVANLYSRPKRPVDAERSYSFPGWLWAHLATGRAPQEMADLAGALNEQAPLCLRVNTLKTTLEDAADALSEKQMVFRPGELAPGSFILQERVPRGAIPHFQEGWFEIQEEGSQLLGVYTAPEPGSLVIDACAGGGGKSLQLAALMKNEGRIAAYDIDRERLGNLPKRAERNGASIIEINPPLKELAPADLVLIDAPCSGTGTLRRNPENRWRLTPLELDRLVRIQRDLLEEWAPRVKEGGLLVYATCSLLEYENEAQTEQFLGRHPEYEPAPPQGFSGPLTERGELKMLPHRHGCDGFYAARLRRKG